MVAYESGHTAELAEALRAVFPIFLGCLTVSLVLFGASAVAGRRDIAIMSLCLPFGVGVGSAIVFWAL